MSEWHKTDWNMDDQEWQAIANSRRQIETSWHRTIHRVQVPSRTASKPLDAITMPAVSHPRSIQPIGIQPWQAEFTKERFASRSRLPLKRSQVELPQFASRR
ncbi:MULTISPECIES: hypothetical protein [unclassified Thermosynechococcus]|uniref:hypothetical protein n=1 Tax=unclassified Thermosynechococcus TaxID=2622553 RepID=UPI002672957E|nr:MULTISPECIES: hypothetical protein [unclassified Thermosynechococcus]MDR5640084.1 hypothetical protein [Thermosynechococcus sp. PP42]MDR7922389.1 hypothetical protein [Thermosynechococcus sp. HY213]WKT80996.1 hypothetical protein QYC27_12020 [Thermosynechococcus sp. PP45]WNC24607.1 hypothetical protein RHH26_12015 [Thermosynechococcus sp. PP551]WNC27185.1 hypothetical protein RHH27_12010 [Thermosynechococcus sp. PP555]